MIWNFRNVPDVFLCIMDSVDECCQGDKDQIDDTLKSVTTALLHACPGECSPAGAADCTTNIIENSCTEIVTSASGDPCTLLIKEYFKYEHCITFNTGVCTEEEKVSTNTTVSLIKREIDLMCNDTMSSTLRPPVTTQRPRPTHNPVTPSTRPTATTGKVSRRKAINILQMKQISACDISYQIFFISFLIHGVSSVTKWNNPAKWQANTFSYHNRISQLQGESRLAMHQRARDCGL